MDVITIGMSAIVSTLATVAIMICFYKFWILPYLTNITNSIPIQVKGFVGPYIDEKIEVIMTNLNGKIDDLRLTVKQTSNRFQRTIKQAESYLGDMDIDLTDENQALDAGSRLANKYGADAAISVFSKVLTSLKNPSKEDPKKEPVVNDGWS